MTRGLPLLSLALAGLVGIIGIATTAHQAPADPPLSWGDQNDGTYRNPILPADFSDPDAIRVGDDFYMVASDFHFIGMQGGGAVDQAQRRSRPSDSPSQTERHLRRERLVPGTAVELKFAKWKGARMAVFCYGPNPGIVDVDYIQYTLTE